MATKSTASGIDTIIEHAEYIGQSVNFPDVNDFKPITNVFKSLSLSNDAENTNSPYIAMKEKKNITTDMDLVNGKIILVKLGKNFGNLEMLEYFR